MLNDSMLNGVSEFEHSSFAAANVISHTHFRLITGAWDNNIVFGSSYAE